MNETPVKVSTFFSVRSGAVWVVKPDAVCVCVSLRVTFYFVAASFLSIEPVTRV